MFTFGTRSLTNLQGVHPDLVEVCMRAIQLSAVDFGITEGLRDAARQQEMLAKGASRTAKSRHLTGHAVDVAAYVGGVVSWAWPLYPQIAHAFRQAGHALHVPLVWGGLWDRCLTEVEYDLEEGSDLYRTRFKAQTGRRPLIDGPHFELDRRTYPPETEGIVTT